MSGAVVSKPTATKTTSRSGSFSASCERVERGVDDAHVAAVGLLARERRVAARHLHHVAEGGDDDVGTLRERDRGVDVVVRGDADRAAGAGEQRDVTRA